MSSPADFWNCFRKWEDKPHIAKIRNVLDTADFSYLCTTALNIRSSLGPKNQSPREERSEASGALKCTIDKTKFGRGLYSMVVELKFSDNTSWVARIKYPDRISVDKDESKVAAEETEKTMISEITTMKYVRAHTTIPIAEVFGYDISSKNPFGFRYILMDLLPGRRLKDLDNTQESKFLPRQKWATFAEQLADYLFQLSTLRFPVCGRLFPADTGSGVQVVPMDDESVFNTSLEYFYANRKRETRWIQEDHEDDAEWGTAAWILEQAVPAMAVEDFLHGPFPLFHLNIHYDNVLVDEDLNITGIIDWSHAQTVPVERFMAIPALATFPGAEKMVNDRINDFRGYFKAALRKREIEANRNGGGGVALKVVEEC